jgi:UDP-2-acetamido-2,6-beta-L-arabino-hexul-4-ose reductase
LKVLVTGSDGFIGRNLCLWLNEFKNIEVLPFTRKHQVDQLSVMLSKADFVIHLAGINRPENPSEFESGNYALTKYLCDALGTIVRESNRRIPVLLTSSKQADLDNPYGNSKRGAEDEVFNYSQVHQVPVYVFRLPNVFGKWCKPNYNSAIATFCHNIARDLPIRINDPNVVMTLVYIDDLVEEFVNILRGGQVNKDASGFAVVSRQYTTTVGEVAKLIQTFRTSRETLVTERVGTGLIRALYCTYVSYLPINEFSYAVPQHEDSRGVFVEMLKTPDCGQFSFFTAHPGVTRGGHYHHSKTEKFLVIKGEARFKFRHMLTGKNYELVTSAGKPEIVETVPGWTHDITNISNEEMVVMLWANEIFDTVKPDTYTCPV